jgi:hypothetical protein
VTLTVSVVVPALDEVAEVESEMLDVEVTVINPVTVGNVRENDSVQLGESVTVRVRDVE